MDLEIKTKNLAVVGDIHGDFPELVWRITERYKITDTTFIIAGDCGIGFDNSLEDMYRRKRMNSKLGNSGNTLLCVRGNHDNPEYYQEGSLIDFPHLKTLPDYTHLSWGDHKILVIGGGVSVDKESRLEDFKKTGVVSWWEGERIIKSSEKLDGQEDIIISHMAPLCIGPVLLRDPQMTYETWEADKSDREYLSTVLKETRPTRWIFGHYHKSTSGDYENCLWRGLDIQEIYEIR